MNPCTIETLVTGFGGKIYAHFYGEMFFFFPDHESRRACLDAIKFLDMHYRPWDTMIKVEPTLVIPTKQPSHDIKFE